MRVMTIGLMWAAIFAALAIIAPSPTNATTVFPPRGGLGDHAQHLRCPAGQVLVGLTGRTGAWIDQVALICAPFQIHPTNKRGPLWTSAAKGGNGGVPRSAQCAGNTFVSAVALATMRSNDGNVFTPVNGSYAFSILMHCRLADPQEPEVGSARYGGAGAFFHGVYEGCPTNELPVGLNLRYGRHVNAVGLICDVVPAWSFVLSGDARYFWVSHVPFFYRNANAVALGFCNRPGCKVSMAGLARCIAVAYSPNPGPWWGVAVGDDPNPLGFQAIGYCYRNAKARTCAVVHQSCF